MEKGGETACCVSPLVEAHHFASTITRNGLANYAQAQEFAATEKSNILVQHAKSRQDQGTTTASVSITAKNILARTVAEKGYASTGQKSTDAKYARQPKKLEQTTMTRQPWQRTGVLVAAVA